MLMKAWWIRSYNYFIKRGENVHKLQCFPAVFMDIELKKDLANSFDPKTNNINEITWFVLQNKRVKLKPALRELRDRVFVYFG